MQVPAALYWHSLLVQRTHSLWQVLSSLETKVLAEELAAVEVKRPIYVSGLARSGSTITLEILNEYPDCCSHRYGDFPYLYTPYWSNWLRQRSRSAPAPTVERSHKDRIQVSEDSPEAMEEPLWMLYFNQLHQADQNQLLNAATDNPAFARVYHDHIRKLLLVRGQSRYLAKGNYNLARLQYLLKLYPDARFVIPVRHPVAHIASLVKQQRLFSQGLAGNQRARNYLQWVGHFEFGPDRRPIHLGDTDRSREIQACWDRGDEVRGWALQWEQSYRSFLERVEANPELAAACEVLRYEQLCDDSEGSLERLFQHCQLDPGALPAIAGRYSERLMRPDYYQPDFSAKELDTIEDVCGATAARMGY